MQTRKRVKEPVLVFGAVCVLLWAIWHFFQYVQLKSVGNSAPPFQAIIAVYPRTPQTHRKTRNQVRASGYYSYTYQNSNGLKISSIPTPHLTKSTNIIYDVETNYVTGDSKNIGIISGLSYLDFKTSDSQNYIFEEGTSLDYYFQLRRYIIGKVMNSDKYIAAEVLSFNVYSGIRTANTWLVIWKKGARQPIYRCPLQGGLLSFELKQTK